MIPLEVDGNFTADASGNGTDKRIILSGHWSAVYASCQCAGSGQWVAGKLGRAQFFQQGANVVLGPIILQPGQQAQVTVAGATPNAAASIVYWGWQSDTEDGADLASVVPSIESAGSLTGSVPISLGGGSVGISGTVTTVGPQTKLGTVTAAAGAISTVTFTVPVSAVALAILPTNGYPPLGGPTIKVLVQGHTTAAVYLQSNATFYPLYCGTAQVQDASVDITLDNTGIGTTSHLDVVAYASAVFPGQAPPQPWQRPNLSAGSVAGFLSLASGANANLIAAPVGAVSIYLFDGDFYFQTAAPAPDVYLDSGAGTNPIASLGNQWSTIRRSGLQLPAASPLRIVNGSGAAQNLTWAAAYSVG